MLRNVMSMSMLSLIALGVCGEVDCGLPHLTTTRPLPHCLVARRMHLSNSPAAIKTILLAKCEAAIDAMLRPADAADSLRDIEMSTWKALLSMGNAMVTMQFARRCEMAMAADLQTRGLPATASGASPHASQSPSQHDHNVGDGAISSVCLSRARP